MGSGLIHELLEEVTALPEFPIQMPFVPFRIAFWHARDYQGLCQMTVAFGTESLKIGRMVASSFNPWYDVVHLDQPAGSSFYRGMAPSATMIVSGYYDLPDFGPYVQRIHGAFPFRKRFGTTAEYFHFA